MTSEVQECPRFQFLGDQLDNFLIRGVNLEIGHGGANMA